ncbi:citrate synthase (unknown stereospecificity) OS=Castellaniella defragrans OX=75697 GN=HNR28_003407 PE=3 SV=1 [Castellaniella defragrans]
MRIGKQVNAFTAIATSDARSITVRGEDLCNDLIGKIDFVDYFWLLVTGKRPTSAQAAVTHACLVAIAEHGLVPSVQASRMTLAADPDCWQGAIAAGLLGMGTVVAGSSEVAGRYLVELVGQVRLQGADADAICIDSLRRLKAAGGKVPGLGHPQHSAGDPRADRLLAIAEDQALAGPHIQVLRVLAKQAPAIFGRALPINVSGAIPAVMLDAGWPMQAMKGIPMVARAMGLVAHLFEESVRPIGFILSHHADLAIQYDGRRSEHSMNGGEVH